MQRHRLIIEPWRHTAQLRCNSGMFSGVVTTEDAANIFFLLSFHRGVPNQRSCIAATNTTPHRNINISSLHFSSSERKSGPTAWVWPTDGKKTNLNRKQKQWKGQRKLSSKSHNAQNDGAIDRIRSEDTKDSFRKWWITRGCIISPLNLEKSWRHMTWGHVTSRGLTSRDVTVPAGSNGGIKVTVSSLDVTWR